MTRFLLATFLIAICLTFAARDAVAMGFPGRQDAVPGAHERGFRTPEITHLVASGDGRYVAAAYFQHAINRPGTDWRAWVALWDRVTGRRVIYRNAFGPVAISSDGGLLAMPLYEPLPNQRNMRPAGPLALWRMGERKPEQVLAIGDPAAGALAAALNNADFAARTPVAVAFASDSRRVVQLTTAGLLALHDAGQKGEGKLLTRVDAKSVGGAWLSSEATMIRLNVDDTELGLKVPGGIRRECFFRYDLDLAAGKATLIDSQVRDTPPASPTAGKFPVIAAFDGKLLISADATGILTVAQKEDGKVLETLRLDDAPPEEARRPEPGQASILGGRDTRVLPSR